MNAADLPNAWNEQIERIQACTSRCGRSASSVQLVAVSKTHPVTAIQALMSTSQRDFGESYVQELKTKIAALPEDLRWHFIGHLQSNKARHVAGRVHLIHSVDRASLIGALAGIHQDILLQVNVSGEPSKSGCRPDEVRGLLHLALQTSGLRVRGLMTMAPYNDDPELARPHFRKLAGLAHELRHELSRTHPGAAPHFCELSMGMSHDLEPAIEEGATLVRIGTAIFGERS